MTRKYKSPMTMAGMLAVSLIASVTACGGGPAVDATPGTGVAAGIGSVYAVHDTAVVTTFDATGVAEAVRQATLSTKLTGSVTAVLVAEGDVVHTGDPLVRIDARELAAREAKAGAAVTEAEAVYRDALTQAARIGALYADSAATRAQFDAAETGLARAEAGARTARAAAAEVRAMASYALVRAPFSGVITKRFVDPGAFAAPGAPLVTVQDVSRLRIGAATTPDIAARLRRGQRIDAVVGGTAVRATVEGVVPATAGNLALVNAIVSNEGRAHLPGSAATLALPTGVRRTLVVPVAAVMHDGDLTGLTVRTASGDERRWVRLGVSAGAFVEVAAGARRGDRVVVSTEAAVAVARN